MWEKTNVYTLRSGVLFVADQGNSPPILSVLIVTGLA